MVTPPRKECAMRAPGHSTLITLGWQSWSVVVIVLTAVLLTLLLFH